MHVDTAILSLDNPVFRTYVLAASIMILKLMFQPWMTVVRMMKAGGGFRSPEDAKKSPLNPKPDPTQLEVYEYVDRSRRINLNDLESIPGFLAAGFLLVLADPPLLLAQILIWTYVASRAAHFVAYVTAQLHDVRDAVTSLILDHSPDWIFPTGLFVSGGRVSFENNERARQRIKKLEK